MQPADSVPAPSIVTLSSREVYRNRWMRVREDEILRSNGEKGLYGVVEKHDSAILLPLDGDQIWLVEQFRYAVREPALELPQGSWEREIEDPEELARGELREEIGRDADSMTLLGKLWIAYGFLRQRQYVYLATGLRPAHGERDAEEHDLTARPVPIADFERMMLDGAIRDNCTLAAWGLYLLWKARRQDTSAV